jgi:hypothetical protein
MIQSLILIQPNLVFWVSRVVDIQTISIAIASASVVAGVVYYALQIRHQTKLKQMDFIMRIPSTFLSKRVIQAVAAIRKTEFRNYDDFEEKCGVESRQVADFGENLGLLVKRRLIDVGLVADRYDVSVRYEKLSPWIEEMRRRASNPRLYEWFEYLYNELKKREQKLQQSKA